MNARRAVVSGAGVVSAYGVGIDQYWQGVSAGRSAAAPITTFDASYLPTRFAAPVSTPDDELDALLFNRRTSRTLSRAGKMAVIAAQEAAGMAQLESTNLDPYRIGTSMGAGGIGLWDHLHSAELISIIGGALQPGAPSGIDFSRTWERVLTDINPLTALKALPNIPTSHIAIALNARGPSLTVTTACTSSAQAIGHAYREITSGRADVMISGGSDAMVNPYGMVAFSMLNIMSRNNDDWQHAARPFDRTRDGFMLGEGAAVVVLEERDHCLRRGVTPLAEVFGYASTSDAYRLTDEPPEAWSSIRAMRLALEDAGVEPAEIDYINAHGTGTQMNDSTETFAMKEVFGEAMKGIPVSSTKSMIGHLIAGAGGIEFVTCLLSLQHETITPTINYVTPDESCDLDYVPNRARPARLSCVMSNSFGFGGQNASIILGRARD